MSVALQSRASTVRHRSRAAALYRLVELVAAWPEASAYRVVDEPADPLRRQLALEALVDVFVDRDVETERACASILYLIQSPATADERTRLDAGRTRSRNRESSAATKLEPHVISRGSASRSAYSPLGTRLGLDTKSSAQIRRGGIGQVFRADRHQSRNARSPSSCSPRCVAGECRRLARFQREAESPGRPRTIPASPGIHRPRTDRRDEIALVDGTRRIDRYSGRPHQRRVRFRNR